MVVVIYKKTEKNSFAVECFLHTRVSALLSQLVESTVFPKKVNNLRMYIDRLVWSVEELANKGVLKPAELQGVSWDDYAKHANEFKHLPEEMQAYGVKPVPQEGQRFVADKHNQRYGIILGQQGQQIMLNACKQAKDAMEFKNEIARKEDLLAAVQGIRSAVMEAYPAYLDLPQWQPSLLMLEEKVELEILETQNFEVFDERATVWWAGKQLQSDKTIGEYAGKNEKTRLIVKVQKWGGQQPLREPPIDAQTYKKMVRYYYKKVDETKQMEKNSVEAHYEKVQAGSMKANLHLGDDIRYKPF